MSDDELLTLLEYYKTAKRNFLGAERDVMAQAAARIREQRDLLDECEKAFDQIKLRLFNGHDAGVITKCDVMLARLRGEPPAQEKADE